MQGYVAMVHKRMDAVSIIGKRTNELHIIAALYQHHIFPAFFIIGRGSAIARKYLKLHIMDMERMRKNGGAFQFLYFHAIHLHRVADSVIIKQFMPQYKCVWSQYARHT